MTSARQGRPVRAASLLASGVLGFSLLATVSVSSAPALAADPTNGPLLYNGGPSHLTTIAGAQTGLEFNSFSTQAFSPDGEKIAVVSSRCLDDNCDATESVVRVNSADGSFVDLAPTPGDVTEVTWSPDQENLAVMVADTFEGDIWRVPVNGDPAVKVLSTTASFRVDPEGLDWSPTSNSLAFVGTPLEDDGSSLAVNTYQLYTVDAFGGAPTKYSALLPADCEFPTCRTIEYTQPDWSPNGTQMAAYVVDDLQAETETIKEYLGVVGAHQLPSEVKRIQTLTDPETYTFLARQRPVWSADGGQLLYATVPDGSTFDPVATVVTVAGAAVATAAEGEYEDWQPCPTGTCVSWGAPTSGADVRVRVTGYADKGQVGAAEPVVVTVMNKGPETADDVAFTVTTSGRSATQAWVRWHGAHDGWTCNTSNPDQLTCAGPSLADEASVVLELGVVGVNRARVSKLTATASTSSQDLRPTNNTVTQQQRIAKLVKPKAPKSARMSAKAARNFGWFLMNQSKQLYILAANIVYKEPVEADKLPGWYGATLWAWAPHQSVYRIKFNNRVCPVNKHGEVVGFCSGFLGFPADGGDCYFASDNYCHLSTGTRVIYEGDKAQNATWKFFPGKHVGGVIIRTGPAKKYSRVLPGW